VQRDSAELLQMAVHELTVEQAKTTHTQTRCEVNQRNLGRITLQAEHGLAKERAFDGNAVKAANELVVFPALDRVQVAHIKEVEIHLNDGFVDPRVFTTNVGSSAELDHVKHRRVAANFKSVVQHRALEALWYVKLIQRQDAAFDGVYPVDIAVVAVVRHGKQANRVSLYRQLRMDDGTPKDVFGQMF